jgi:hypothetical protein
MLLNATDMVIIENSIISQTNACKFLDIVIRSNNEIRINNLTLTKSYNTHDNNTIAQLLKLESNWVDLNQAKFENNTIFLANLLTIRAEFINLTDVSFRNNEMMLGIMVSIDPGMA